MSRLIPINIKGFNRNDTETDYKILTDILTDTDYTDTDIQNIIAD